MRNELNGNHRAPSDRTMPVVRGAMGCGRNALS